MNVHENWVAEDYLKEYYLTNDVAEDELYVFEYLINFLKKQNKKFKSVLDFGCGPTIHHIIPIVKFTDQIFLSDFLPQNLNAIKSWLNKKTNSHNWKIYIKGVLEIEKKIDLITNNEGKEESLILREEIIRKSIHGLMQGDIFISNPIFPFKDKFELITSFYCAEATTLIKEEWYKVMSNLLSLVAPHGWFLTSAIKNSKGYKVGDNIFPSANIDENDMMQVLRENGFIDIDVKAVPVKIWTNHGFDSIILAKARKR